MNSGIWSEISSTQNRGKPNTFDEICKLDINCSMKLQVYIDDIPGNPPRVSTILQYPWQKLVDIETKPGGFKKKLKTVERHFPFHGFGSSISACEQIHTIF